MNTKEFNNWVKPFSILMLIVFFSSATLFAQAPPPGESRNEISDEELETFVDVAVEIMPLQQEAQRKMVEEIEDNGLSVERFNSILEAQTRGMEPEATEEEMESFDNTMNKIEDIQVEYQEKIAEEIEKAGMSPERFDEILARYQQDPELQMRVHEKMETGG